MLMSETVPPQRFVPYPSADRLAALRDNPVVRATMLFWAHNPDFDLDAKRCYTMDTARYVLDKLEMPIGEAATALTVLEAIAVSELTLAELSRTPK